MMIGLLIKSYNTKFIRQFGETVSPNNDVYVLNSSLTIMQDKTL